MCNHGLTVGTSYRAYVSLIYLYCLLCYLPMNIKVLRFNNSLKSFPITMMKFKGFFQHVELIVICDSEKLTQEQFGPL